MDVVDISRWQFGITTVYHFIFVPLTIGMAPLVAIMQTMWALTSKPHWYRATRFFGNVLLINFAMGVATGIVQEFQFGMNWSEYSRMVGDVFGGPLALEGLIAFSWNPCSLECGFSVGADCQCGSIQVRSGWSRLASTSRLISLLLRIPSCSIR